MEKGIVFFDTEVGVSDGKIRDCGAVRSDGAVYRGASESDFTVFCKDAAFLCGHNIFRHDLNYFKSIPENKHFIDTLCLSPLLFPKRPYHALLKDDKLLTDELNNPVNDSIKAQSLFYDEVNAFNALPRAEKCIYYTLLHDSREFEGFFEYIDYSTQCADAEALIKSHFDSKICTNADLSSIIRHYPTELCYALALISTDDYHSVTPPWLLHNYPKTENIIKLLRSTPCTEGCKYCRSTYDIHNELRRIFGYAEFRTFDGEPLQERAVRAATDGKSMLVLFPTGGGKSLTFQLPALMAGQAVHGLTVVISPLQSLMKDQVDKLSEMGITDAVTINGLQDPIERANSIERVANGMACILYISPEQLRSKTIESLLKSRTIARFVVDEAHCFSAWGQDFRVDYLYIGDFIAELQKSKNTNITVPVSCFTATAKQKVISDICDYFKRKLNLDLEIFASSSQRSNLRYTVLYKETDEEKYIALRDLLSQRTCPAIIYVSRTKRSHQIADRLCSDGFSALPYNGKMDAADKIANQEAFLRDEVQIIVATSAFGMGVDKKNVGLVVHYDISDSLENYVQEAGRAGRDPSMEAECFVLYNDNDLDKHFILLNQTKLSISEIQQVWSAIKKLTDKRKNICVSPLEIARAAGWDDSVSDIEVRVKTAVAALETAGYIKRGHNVPHVYATSILAKNMAEAAALIEKSSNLTDAEKQTAKRIIKFLISAKSVSKPGNDDAEARVDYIADTLGLTKDEVISCINIMRQESILADTQDMTAYIYSGETENRALQTLERFSELEHFILDYLTKSGSRYELKKMNEDAQAKGIKAASIKNIRTLLYYLTIKSYIRKTEDESTGFVYLSPVMPYDKMQAKVNQRIDIAEFILKRLYETADRENCSGEIGVQFSLVGLMNEYKEQPRFEMYSHEINLADVEDALLYLSKIGAMRLEGGFLVLYSGMEIRRIVMDNKVRYKAHDYRFLDAFYKQKIQQIHIVGEYANLCVRDLNAALQFVNDYFTMDFRKFIAKYFRGERAAQIERNITPEKYEQLFGTLSQAQLEIVDDSFSKYIVAAAGPGSGKTRVLVHKLASLLLMEDVKHEQLLMLTFSRAAATEFKKRLYALIGNAAKFVDVKTFHSYCFDLVGRIGKLSEAEHIVETAVRMIENDEIEQGRITKSVLVIDEAQDMDEHEYALLCALTDRNPDMRVIAVGDDDQSIYEFRGASPEYLMRFAQEKAACMYELSENYRSTKAIVELANAFASTISHRMKSRPVESVTDDTGIVEITHHISRDMTIPLAEHIRKTPLEGKVCALVSTNEEALRLAWQLKTIGINTKLIQSIDGFSLINLSEVRFLLKVIDSSLRSPVISSELWEQAKSALKKRFARSSCLQNCLNMMSDFETINPTKYRTDFEEFIRESNYEDFYSDEEKTVFISTIHKSKGREYDTVFMLLNRYAVTSDGEKRALYVGMTRAKSALYIHCNTDIFSELELKYAKYDEDFSAYPEPETIELELSYKDVVLNFFKGKKGIIFKMMSGDSLALDGDYLTAEINTRTVNVVKFSAAAKEKLSALYAAGYEAYSAEIRFIVAWKGEDDTEESAVILPNIVLKKKKSE